MDHSIFMAVATPITQAAGSQVASWLKGHVTEGEDEVTVDQLVGLGILKSQSDLWSVDSEILEANVSFVEDFETLRLQGFSNTQACKTACLIYAPRLYLVQHSPLSNDFIVNLDDEEIKLIVDNTLLNYLEINGINPVEDLNYLVASLDTGEIVNSYTN